MEAGFIALAIIRLIIGVVGGMFIEKSKIKHRATQGSIIVDCSDPEDGPYMFAQYTIPVSEILSRKQVLLDIEIRQ